MDDFFHVAIMTPVLHYTMGGLEINPKSQEVDANGKPIPDIIAALNASSLANPSAILAVMGTSSDSE